MNERVKRDRVPTWAELIKGRVNHERTSRYTIRDPVFSGVIKNTIIRGSASYNGTTVVRGDEYGDVDSFPDLINTKLVGIDDIKVVLNEAGTFVPLRSYHNNTQDRNLGSAIGIYVDLKNVRKTLSENGVRVKDNADYILLRRKTGQGTSSFDKYVVPKIQDLLRSSLIESVQ